VSWIDEEMEDDKSLIVKTVNSRSRPRPRLQDGEELDVSLSLSASCVMFRLLIYLAIGTSVPEEYGVDE